MNKPSQTKTFASGNSVAVHLPDDFDIPIGVEVEVSKVDDQVIIRKVRDEAEAKRAWIAMLDTLKALPKPPYIEKRERFYFPERKGL